MLRSMGVPCLIHQPSYSLFNRWVETSGLLKTLEQEGMGAIVFSPLAQGLLTDKYLRSVPEDSRAGSPGSFDANLITEEVRNSLMVCRKLLAIVISHSPNSLLVGFYVNQRYLLRWLVFVLKINYWM